jgi:hypothetical protein
VTVVITDRNRPPVAEDDSATVEREGTVVIPVLANDKDSDGDELSVSEVSPPSHGTATVIASGSDAGKVRYVHDGGEATSDRFTYTVSDGQGGTDTATVTVTIDDADLPLPDIELSALGEDALRVIPLPDGRLSIHEGASGSFSIRLKSEPAGDVTVTGRIDNADIEISPTRLTFTASDWDTWKSVHIEVAKDSDTEDDHAVFSYSIAGYGNTKEGSVRIIVRDEYPHVDSEEERAVTETVKAVAGAIAANVASNIGTRFSAARGASTLTLGGRRINLGSAPVVDPLLFADRDPFAEPGDAGATRPIGLEELLGSSAFELALGAADDGTPNGSGPAQWTLWGRGDLQLFESDPTRGTRYDGDLKAGYLGVEAWTGERWLVGVAGSRTRAEVDYGVAGGGGEDGRLRMDLTSVHPYVRYALDERSEAWAFLGLGRGEIEIDAMGPAATRDTSDVSMVMGSVGGRRALEPAGAVDLALLGDWGFARVRTDAALMGVAIRQLAVDTWRGRVGMEGSHTFELESGGALTPFLEVAGRYDGGDGEDEVGVELSGGMLFANPALGLGLEARGRALAWHSAEDYDEYGVSVTASLAPRPDGTGLSLSVSPRWGAATGGADALWREDGLGAHGLGPDEREALSLDARTGYGLRAMGGLLTSFGELGLLEQNRRRLRLGLRFDVTKPGGAPDGLSIELSGERYESGERTAPDHRVSLTGRLRF